jgi:hypothetical protein
MSSFVHPALLWALGAMALPVLIHLINMMRHRRVEWAAMEFLLVSQKKHRTWIIFKQLLLLLLRIAALVAVVLMVAQPRLQSRAGILGGTRTHHIILLDDSFSMSDRWSNTDAFSEAKKVVERIGADAVRRNAIQSLTLLRFSRVERPQRPTEPDLLKESVTSKLADKLGGLLAKITVSDAAAGPGPAMRAVAQLLGDDEEEHRVVYLISDFRARQWNDPTDLRKELEKLAAAGAELHLIDCVDRARPNLAIVSLAPADGLRAAGVPWLMDVVVQNFGAAPVRDVSVALAEGGHGRPAVTLAEIPAGKTASERFLVNCRRAGLLEITARLNADAVAADNYRYAAVDLPADVPVLLIDDDPRARNARALQLALAPGEPARTGIRPRIETRRWLIDKPLAEYRAVHLANVERLEASAVTALEQYAAAGGGVAFFVGDQCDPKFYNEVLYRGGKGLFPAPLGHAAELVVDRLDPAPDLQADPHDILRVFSGKQNSYLQTVKVDRYFAVAAGWRPPARSTVRVVASLRNGAPAVIGRDFGKGRVVAFLTAPAPGWSNLASNPAFVVTILELESHLAQQTADESRPVGSPIEVRLDPSRYQPHVRVTPPGQSGVPAAVAATPTADGMLTASLSDIDRSGFYEVRLARTDNTEETRRYAVNVDPAEGDLRWLDGQQLAARLGDLKYHYEQAAMFQTAAGDQGGRNLGEIILYALVLLLVGEQILAYSASYHPPRRAAHSPGGAA